MTTINPDSLHKGKFSAAIMLCDSKIALLKNKPDRAKKYEALKKAYQEAQTKLKTAIDATKNINIANPTDKNKPSFYNEFISGKEEFVSICWLSSKLNSMKDNGELAAGEESKVDALDLSVKTVDVKYDFIDATKNAVKHFTNGTGASKKIAKGCLFVSIGELLSRGVTAFLAKKGIMDGSLGLIGLGKLGLAQLPKLVPIVQTAAKMFMGLPQLTLAAGAAFAVFKGVPKIKKFVDNVKKNNKNAQAFDKGMEDILNKQQQTVLA